MRAAVVHYMYAEWLQSIYVWFYDAFPQVYVHIHQKMDLTLLKFLKKTGFRVLCSLQRRRGEETLLSVTLEQGIKLTGHANWKGIKILPASSILFGLFFAPLKENIFPPRTCVDPAPNVQEPVVVTSIWYSFRQTLK